MGNTTKGWHGTKEGQLKGTANSNSDVAKLKAENKKLLKQQTVTYKNLIELGMTQNDIWAIFGMGAGNTVPAKKNNPELVTAYIEAMDALEQKLCNRMIKQAIGYDYEEEKTTLVKKGGKWVASKKEKFIKHHPGSAPMFTLLMTNRFGDRWKISREVVKKDESYDKDPADRARKQITSLARDVLAANSDDSDGEHQLQDGTSRIPNDIVEVG